VTIIERLSATLEGRYVIERELGAGGMATVYLAQDVRHDRRVALKVLRPELSAILGGERFLHEIKTTANLQHPHILSLFDSGEADGLVFYVMPYVDGESLRDRLTREKQLPVDEAIRIAREVADALDYAHRQGIVHRDIKPENILLHGGHAMVADFGIALAASRSEGGTRMTETGMSLGTPHYMSPEQAMGEREITPKADIYALGCVLYEMLTAEPPFVGATAQAIIARVMTEEPRSLTLQRRTIPPHVEAAVRTALEKLPADRFASAAAFAEALGNPAFASAGATLSRTAAASARQAPGVLRRVGAAVPWLVAVAAVAAALGTRRRPEPAPPPLERYALTFGRGAELSDATGSPIAFAADGSRIAYVGLDSERGRWLFSREMGRVDPLVIPGTKDAMMPFFSPDGQWIGYWQESRLRKVSLSGGAVVTLCEAPNLYGASWGDNDTIVFSSDGRLLRVAAAGGRPDTLAAPDSSSRAAYRFPHVLPRARAVVFTILDSGAARLGTLTIGDSAIRRLDQSGMSPFYVSGGYLLFAQSDGTVFSAPFDPERLIFSGSPQPVVEGVRLGPAQVAKMGVSLTGAVAYTSGGAGARTRDVVIVDREGRIQRLPAAADVYQQARFSPDGNRIAVGIQYVAALGVGDIWIYDIEAGSRTRLTFDSLSINPEWTPDGRSVAYSRIESRDRRLASLFRIAADGSGVPETVLVRPNPVFEVQYLPNGRAFVFRESATLTNRDIWFAPADSPAAARPLLRTPFEERAIALSPDGRWLAYVSNEAGSDAVYVRGLEPGSARWRVSVAGGTEPRWARSGRELFFRNADSVFVSEVRTSPGFHAGAPRALIAADYYASSSNVLWDVAPDGRRFVFVARSGGREIAEMHLLLHWFDQLRGQQR
jgi:serine/threonine-protein kinase